MKLAKRILILTAVLTMALCFCACSKEQDDKDTDVNDNVQQTEQDDVEDDNVEEEDDGKVEYTVKVVDEDGNPISGAMVQLCFESCVPGPTDADGVATFNLEEADYKASMLTMPEGYDYSTEVEEFYFDDDSTEITITLKKVQ